jgi:hypothetical protein
MIKIKEKPQRSSIRNERDIGTDTREITRGWQEEVNANKLNHFP